MPNDKRQYAVKIRATARRDDDRRNAQRL